MAVNTNIPDSIKQEKDSAARDSLILALYKREPERAIFIAKQLGSPLATKLKGTQISQIDTVTENILKTIFIAESTVANASAKASSTIASGIDKVGDSIVGGIQQAKLNLSEALKPVSRATGEVIGTATKVIENPLGVPFVIGNSLGHLIDKINPGFTNRLDAAYKKMGVQNLSHFPAQVVGSLKQLMSTAATIACLPLSLIGDLNQALINISNAINKLIGKVSAAINDFFLGPGGVLDSILPLDSIAEFLSAVQDLSTILSAVSILSGGSISFLNNLGSVNSFISSATLTFSNPSALLTTYLNNNSGFGQVAAAVRNPQGALLKLLPPKTFEKFMKLSTFCSVAQTGDLGFAFSAFLGGPKARALSYLLNRFSNKSNTVKPLLGLKTTEEVPAVSPPKQTKQVVGTQPVDTVTNTPTPEVQSSARPAPPLPEKEPELPSGESAFPGLGNPSLFPTK